MDHNYLRFINFLNLRDPEIICNIFTQTNKIYVIVNVCVDTVNEYTLRMCKINRSRCFSKRLVSKEVVEVSTCFCWFYLLRNFDDTTLCQSITLKFHTCILYVKRQIKIYRAKTKK